ncbi:hypothetical protein H5410_015309 [Solanum commersonii]|uniref:Uncharacterized protein n=1 Tax=Solanum commersonii TaxID=4109 RepID=A0A9J5ZT66_SOLCO|nr:hypothetical protein H5410_015309 [Solanum commersonii]
MHTLKTCKGFGELNEKNKYDSFKSRPIFPGQGDKSKSRLVVCSTQIFVSLMTMELEALIMGSHIIVNDLLFEDVFEYIMEKYEDSNAYASIPYGLLISRILVDHRVDLSMFNPVEINATFDSLTFSSMGYVHLGNKWVKKDSVKAKDTDELKTHILATEHGPETLQEGHHVVKLSIAMTGIKQNGVSIANKLIKQVDSLKSGVESSNTDLAISVQTYFSGLSKNVERSYNSFYGKNYQVKYLLHSDGNNFAFELVVGRGFIGDCRRPGDIQDMQRFWGVEQKNKYDSFKSRPIFPDRRLVVCSTQIFVSLMTMELEALIMGSHIIVNDLLFEDVFGTKFSDVISYMNGIWPDDFEVSLEVWFKEYIMEKYEDSNAYASIPYGLLISRILVDHRVDLSMFNPVEINATFDSLTFSSMGYVHLGNKWVKKDSVKAKDTDELKTHILATEHGPETLQEGHHVVKLRIAMTGIKQNGVSIANKLIKQVDSLKSGVESSNTDLAISVQTYFSGLSKNVERSYNSFYGKNYQVKYLLHSDGNNFAFELVVGRGFIGDCRRPGDIRTWRSENNY